MKILGGMHACDGEEEECLCGTTTSHVQLQWHVHSTAFIPVSLDINKPFDQFLQTADTWKVKNTS